MALLKDFNSCHQTVRESGRRILETERRQSLGSISNFAWMSGISKAATGLHQYFVNLILFTQILGNH